MNQATFIPLSEFIQRLELAQEQLFSREKIAKQLATGTFGELVPPVVTSTKALSSSWAAHGMTFIWQNAKLWIEQEQNCLGLSRLEGKELVALDANELSTQMSQLIHQQFCFPTSRLRAAASITIDYFVTNTFEQLKKKCPEAYKQYSLSLKQSGVYWFRRSPEEQIWTGMHTALSAYFKMAESCASALCYAKKKHSLQLSDLQMLFSQACNLVLYIATCPLEVLHAVEGYIWDHAGSEPMRGFSCNEDGKQLLIDPTLLTVVEDKLRSLKTASHSEPRIGCPAFVAQTAEGSVMKEVQKWCDSILNRFYWPAVVAYLNSES